MNDSTEVRWRLRDGKRIVGFERHMSGRIWSSPDGLWWRGQRLNYDEKDRCFGAKDINNHWLYENDVVTMKGNDESWKLLCKRDGWFLSSKFGTELALTENRLYRRVGFSFSETLLR